MSGGMGDAAYVTMSQRSSHLSAGAMPEQRFSRQHQLTRANPRKGLGSCLLSPLWQLPLGSGLQLTLTKMTPVDHLDVVPPTLCAEQLSWCLHQRAS